MTGKGKVPSATSSHATGVISRSISACNRCRSRKTKCDQLFPSCTACTRAAVECVGIDAATGREIPRSYVDWLERRVKHLEGVLELKKDDGDDGAEEPVADTPAERRPSVVEPHSESAGTNSAASDAERKGSVAEGPRGLKRGSVDESASPDEQTTLSQQPTTLPPPLQQTNESPSAPSERQPGELRLRPDIENLIDQVGVVGLQGTSATGFLGGSSGISFARLMFSAVKMQSGNEQHGPSLITPPTAPPRASPPDASVTSTTIPSSRQRTTTIRFPERQVAEQLIDTYFQQANPQFPILHRPSFEPILDRVCTREESAFSDLKISSDTDKQARIQHSADLYFTNMCFAIASAMSSGTGNLPERYHATAMQHVDALFSSISVSNNRLDGLKGVLLLALYSMMRPAAPGVWYVLGSALRLAVDLGLHQENTERAERQWDPVALDERRRLFWCTYSIDRQVCVYLGRPFGISDDAVNTPFPEDVSDECITPQGVLPEKAGKRSSRTISILMFRIRKLQSEIQQILYQVSELPRKFCSLDEWRNDVQDRLLQWYYSVPKTRNEAGSGYNLGFVDLNYQQTRLLLYGLSPAIPRPSVDALAIIADSGSRIIQAYSHLHREKSINYTWLACHNLFMAGTSYLCALWHSARVRSSASIEQITANADACVEVLGSMIDRCPAALTCRDVFHSLATSTVQLCTKELRSRSIQHSQQQQNSHLGHTYDSHHIPNQRPPQKRIKVSKNGSMRSVELSPSMPPHTPQFTHQNHHAYQDQPRQQQQINHHTPLHHSQQQQQQQLWTPPCSDSFSPSSSNASPPTSSLSPSSNIQPPASLANILQSQPQSQQQQLSSQLSPTAAPPATSLDPQQQQPIFNYTATAAAVGSDGVPDDGNNDGMHLLGDAFAVTQTPWIDMGPGGQMQPMSDGNRLFEMIREMGAAGGWDSGAGAAGAGMGVWGFEGGGAGGAGW